MPKGLVAALAWCLLAASVQAQVAFDAAAGNTTASAATLTVSHTLGGGSNRAVYACVHANGESFGTSGATYNGVDMTELYDGTPGAPSFRYIALFRILEANLPSAGTYNVVFTPSANVEMAGGAVSFSSVNQGDPDDAIATPVAGSGTTPSVTVTGEASVGDMILDCTVNGWGDTATAGTSQTRRVDAFSGDEFVGLHMSTENSAASVVMDWTLGGSIGWASTGLNINAAAGGGAPAGPRLLMGVGK